jgi:hypothetical protein
MRVLPGTAVRSLAVLSLASLFLGGNAAEAGVLLYSRPGMGVVLESGSARDRIVYSQGAHVAPRLCPDATRILFNSREGGRTGVWIAALDGSERQRICDGSQAAWLPDGSHIVFERDGAIVERDLATGEEQRISPEGAPPLGHPVYLPGEEAPAACFLCTARSGTHLYLLAPTSEPPLVSLADGEIAGAARPSPDGKMVAYQDGAHIHLLELGTGKSRQLTVEPGVQATPVWGGEGKALCYAYAVSPHEESWEIRCINVGRPGVVHRVARDVHPGFDLAGPADHSSKTIEVQGLSLALWQGQGPFEPGVAPEARPGWKPVTEHALAGPVAEDLAVENDWLVVHVTREGVRLLPKAGDTFAHPLVLCLIDESANTTAVIADIHSAEQSDDEVTIRVAFLCAENRVVPATLAVQRTRPFIRAKLDAGVGSIGVQADMALVVVPDRFSSDVLVSPGQRAEGAVTPLPRAPVVLGCLSGDGAMVMVASAADDASFSLSCGGGDGTTNLAVAPGGGEAVIALLTSPLWHEPALGQRDGGEAWSATWQRPFPAEWRMSARGATASCSRMWNTMDLRALCDAVLPIEVRFDEAPDTAVVYAWARDAMTPAGVLTPTDILTDALGIAGAAAALDTEGLRGYRTGPPDTPFLQLTTHGADWHPALAMNERGAFGVLETMGSVFPVNTPGVRSLITHLGSDAVSMLEGLDQRIAEYEDALAGMAALCDAQAGSLGSIRVLAEQALAAGCARPRMGVAQVSDALQGVLAGVGARDALTFSAMEALSRQPGNEEWARTLDDFTSYFAAQEGRVWHDGTIRYELWYDDAFQVFARVSQKALAERRAVLAEYRRVAKSAYDAAGRAVVSSPELKPIADALRERARNVLRNRYYLEGDWRGETPLPAGRRQ